MALCSSHIYLCGLDKCERLQGKSVTDKKKNKIRLSQLGRTHMGR